MKKIYIFTFLSLLSLSNIFAISASEQQMNGVDRYAIYIGANNGGKERERLLYAGSDAISFKQTMSEIGGVTEANSRLLIDPTKNSVDKALQEITNIINSNEGQSKRSEFIFYYSGHSDENSLLLGNTQYDYSSLKAAISAVPSDIHVVILDSCYSGNFIRTKGGQKRKPFLLDDSTVVSGHAYLSSSSDNESSQESDEIESSYFTNAMITGLRGAADTSGDNKVTLNELYSYAFNDTLSKTESSKAGPQHPNYNITLVGSGDLVLSDLSNGEAMLSLSKNAKGKFIIRDQNEKLISEINKIEGQPIFMALPAGQYSAIIIEEFSTKQGTFILEKDQIYVLDQNSLTSMKRKPTRLRGESTRKQPANTLEDDDIDNSDSNTEVLDTDDLERYPIKTEHRRKRTRDAEILEEDLDLPEIPEILPAVETAKTEEESPEWFNYSQFKRSPDTKVFQVGLVPGFTFVNPDARTSNVAFGIFGITTDNIRGVQMSSVMNVSHGNILGYQASSIFNFTYSDILGIQASGIFNTANNIVGLQSTGIFNIAEYVQGAQVAGVFNFSQGIKGAQVAGVYSSSKNVKGAQVSGVVNIAEKVTGAQVSGVVNIAKEVNGAQIGIVNFAEKNNGIAIGLFNYIKDGVHDVNFAWDTDNMFDTYLRTGTHLLFFTLGYMCESENTFKNKNYFITYAGIGTEIAADGVRLSIEYLSKYVYYCQNQNKFEEFKQWYIPSIRYTLGFNFSILSLYASTSFDIFIPEHNDFAYSVYGYYKRWVWDFDSFYISPALQFGFGIKF